MNLSFIKCPRCGTMRPEGEVAHTCVVRSTVPDHETAKAMAENVAFLNGHGALSQAILLNLSRAYLDLVAREQRAVELLREVCVQYECTDFNVTSDLYEKARVFLAERREA